MKVWAYEKALANSFGIMSQLSKAKSSFQKRKQRKSRCEITFILKGERAVLIFLHGKVVAVSVSKRLASKIWLPKPEKIQDR